MSQIALRLVTALTVLIVCSSGIAGDDVAKSAGALSQLDAKLLGEADADMVRRDLRARIRAANDRGTAAWRSIQSVADWEKYRDARLALMKKSLGEFPEPPRDLKARVTGRIEGDGFVIENTVLQSRPGFWVTANVYVPAGAGANRPGLVINGAHHTSKEHGELQDMGMTWARNGCVVIVPDHLGYGERREHPFASQDDYAGQFQLGRQNYFFRYDTGMHLHLVGDSLLGWMAYDLGRCVDYLLSRPDVDKSRIIVLGGVAGGGEPAATIAAIDNRIAGAVIFNFGGPQPETRYPLPEDAETSFNYAGGGGWESTRNQRWSAAGDGFLRWVVVAIAPRPLGYAHEFSWDRERDPVWKRYEKLYALYRKRENVAGIHGRGVLSGRPPEASHCTHIGKLHREMIHPAFRQWFGIDVQPDEEYSQRIDSGHLKAMTGEAERELKPRRLVEILPELADQRLARARAKYENAAPAGLRQALRAAWDAVLQPTAQLEPSSAPVREKPRVVTTTVDATAIPGAQVERVVLQVEREIKVPLVIVRPAAAQGRLSVVVGVAQEGKAGFLRNRSEEIARLLASGIAVCLPDLRSTGESQPGRDGGPSTSRTSESSTELMLGGTMVGAKARDLSSVLGWLRSRDDIDGARIALWGESFAPVNPPGTNFKIPRRVSTNVQQSEPAGALLALLGALYDDDVAAVYAAGGLGEFRSVLTNQIVFIPHDVLVPGMVNAGDMCDLAAAVAPRPLRLAALVDQFNQSLPADAAQQCYARTAAAYQRANAANSFTIADGAASPAEWLAAQLKAGQ